MGLTNSREEKVNIVDGRERARAVQRKKTEKEIKYITKKFNNSSNRRSLTIWHQITPETEAWATAHNYEVSYLYDCCMVDSRAYTSIYALS